MPDGAFQLNGALHPKPDATYATLHDPPEVTLPTSQPQHTTDPAHATTGTRRRSEHSRRQGDSAAPKRAREFAIKHQSSTCWPT